MTGTLIDFEGIDASGKTTQALMLAERLQRAGKKVVLTKEPFIELPAIASIISGAGSIKNHKNEDTLSKLLHYSLAPQTDAFLFAADRSEHVHKVISPSLAEGNIVITDRYYPSSIAYQCALEGLDEQWVRSINSFAPAPHTIILLDMDPTAARERVAGHTDRRLAHFETLEKQVKVRAKYIDLAKKEKWIVIDASKNREEVHQDIVAALSQRGML